MALTCPQWIVAVGVGALGAANMTSAQNVCPAGHLSASDGGSFDFFGWSVAVSGDSALIGAPVPFSGPSPGSAYVFRLHGTSWVQTQELFASDGEAGDEFGHALAVDGDTAMVSAFRHVHDGSGGAVYVFNKRDGAWVETQEILNGIQFDGFSFSIDLHGDLAVIGASHDDDNGANAGAAYVFRFDGASWVQEQKLLASDGAAGNFFGWSVAVSGDVALIGAHGHSDGCPAFCASGAAYVYRFDPASSQWVEEQKLLASDASSSDLFGWSVSVSGDVALIGARTDEDGGNDSGSAYAFRFDPDGSRWRQEQKIVGPANALTTQFGYSVAVQGDVAVIGAWLSSDVGSSFGSAYVFRYREATGWVRQQRLLPDPGPTSALFGFSVAVGGDHAVVGAYGENGAYVYAGLSDSDCNANGQPDGCDIVSGTSKDADGNGIPDECVCAWDLDGSGDVGITDLLALLAAWNTNPGGPPDFDGDGNVGITDLLILLANWGPCS